MAYFMLPVLFVRTVLAHSDLFGLFVFSYETLSFTYLIVFITSIVIFGFSLRYKIPYLSIDFYILERNDYIYTFCKIIALLFVGTSLYALFKIFTIIKTQGFLLSYFLLDSEGDKYRTLFKFQTLRYFAISAIFYLYVQYKNKKIFLVFLPNILFEVLAGKRTTAFLFILFIYLIIVKKQGKMYLKNIGIVFIILLSSVLFSRMGTISNGKLTIELFLASMLGEFINTFLTLPYIIERNLLGSMSFQQIVYDSFSAFLPGTIKSSIYAGTNLQELGSVLASHINKGYGLGANVLTTFLCAFGPWGLLVTPMIFVLILYLDSIIIHDEYFLLRFYIIYQLRLFMRQGYESLAVVIYIFCFYCAFFYLSSAKPRKRDR
jgi:hypothetical protein